MNTCTTTGPLLSKWWTTSSAKAALERAKQQKREKIERLRQSVAERKAKLEQEVWSED